MPKYRYIALDLQSKKVMGEQDAASVDDLYTLLRAKSLTLTDSMVVNEIKTIYKLKAIEVSDFARQMSEMLGSGLTIIKALDILRKRAVKQKLRAVYDQVYKYIYEGMTMSEALRRNNLAFPELFCNMCEAGEASGQLENTMRRMAVHYDKEYRLNKKVQGATTYPIILLFITLAAVVALFVFILPQFLELFQDLTLPLPTRIVMGISNAMTGYWYIFISVGVGVPLLWLWLLKKPQVRLAYDKFKFKIPIIHKMLRIIYTARFARSLNSLYSSGLPLIEALTIASRLTGNKYIESQFPPVISDVRNGGSLSDAIKRILEFDNKLATTIFIGEESGRLGPMLESTADSYDFEAETATENMVAVLQPVLIVGMALVIGLVMLSVFLPIFQLYNNVEALS